MRRTARRKKLNRLAALGLCAALVSSGCIEPANPNPQLEIIRLKKELDEKNNQLTAQKATIDELQRRLNAARGFNPDKLVAFLPERLEIDRLSGGYDENDQPGDDGVTVYLKPLDKAGDVLKFAGDIHIELYDLAAEPDRNRVGEYTIKADKVGDLWYGKLMTNHYTIKCSWQHGPPKHPEITIRATFVDALTLRVMSAQATCTVKLPP